MMTEEESKTLAQQLRKPEGEMGLQVGERMNHGNQYMNRNTIDALNLTAGDHVLEIGMANGFFVNEIFAKYGDILYTGCDFSELMVRESIKINAELVGKQKASFYCDRADQLSLKDQSVDRIFTINTLYFWENPENILAELKRVLKQDGQLLITIRPKEYMQHFEFTKYGFNMYSKDEAVDLLEKNGFTVIEVLTRLDPPIEMMGMQIEPESLILIARTV